MEEARLEETEAGLVPVEPGWFVVNARDARWVHRPGRGDSAPLTGWTDAEAETLFPALGVNLVVLEPGQPIGMYHWEADPEAFLVLEGTLRLDFRDGSVTLEPGELYVVPRGVEHKPFAEREVRMLLIEPRGTLNTGAEGGERTAENDIWI